MIKSELILRIAEQNPHLYARDVERVVNVILSRVTDALAAGGRVELRGFGAFTVKTRAAREGRNPKTGEQVAVDTRTKVAFKPSRVMADRLNGSYEPPNVILLSRTTKG